MIPKSEDSQSHASHSQVDIVCFGVGSGGTVTGVGKYLREKKKEVSRAIFMKFNAKYARNGWNETEKGTNVSIPWEANAQPCSLSAG